MVITLDGIVRESNWGARVLDIVPVAAIDTVCLDAVTRITDTAGGSVSHEDIQAGTRIRVSGRDRGGNRLRAASVVIIQAG